jgi:hypothetical protein
MLSDRFMRFVVSLVLRCCWQSRLVVEALSPLLLARRPVVARSGRGAATRKRSWTSMVRF